MKRSRLETFCPWRKAAVRIDFCERLVYRLVVLTHAGLIGWLVLRAICLDKCCNCAFLLWAMNLI